MMLTWPPLLLAFSFLVKGELSPVSEVKLMKNQILLYDKYLYTMALNTELETCTAYSRVLLELKDITPDLWGTMSAAKTQLNMIVEMAKGTPAEGCVNSFSTYLSDLVSKENAKYEECLSPAPSRQKRLAATLVADMTSYYEDRDRALTGLDYCLTLFPSKDKQKQRNSCTQRYRETFNQRAKALSKKHSQSPCMNHFEDTVMSCLESSSKSIATGVTMFFNLINTCNMLINNSNISGTIDIINNTSITRTTVHDQIKEAQKEYSCLNSAVEKELETYYELERKANETYILEALGPEYFRDKLTETLGNYFESINKTMTENPSPKDTVCGEKANQDILNTIEKASKTYESCDKAVVDDVTHSMQVVKNLFSNITSSMPMVGNAAILTCIGTHGFWATNTVLECYKLTLRGFMLRWDEAREGIINIEEKMKQNYFDYFKHPRRPLPCGMRKFKEIELRADVSLYDYTRCIFSSTGTDYPVIPVPNLSTTTEYNPLPTTTVNYRTVLTNGVEIAQ